MSETTVQSSVDIEALSQKKAEDLKFSDLVNISLYRLLIVLLT
jgi:hypothetical protein